MIRFFSLIAIAALFSGMRAQDISLSTSDAGDDFIEIYMVNTAAVGEFQLTMVDNPEAFSITGASEGSAGDAGFTVITDTQGLIMGFSLTGTSIPVGEGVLCIVSIAATGDFTQVTLENIIFSDPDGFPLTVVVNLPGGVYEWGEPSLDPPSVIIVSPSDGEIIYGMTMEVSVDALHMNTGDQFHAYLDGVSFGMHNTDEFTLSDVPYGPQELTVTICDESDTDYDNPEATDTVNFENQELILEGNTLFLGEVSITYGESGDIEMSLDNENLVGGFQLRVLDLPDYVDAVDISPTDRTPGFSISFNEQEDGSVIIVGFDLTLAGITPGTGPIFNITYSPTVGYNAELTLSILDDGSILSDPAGNPLEFESVDGIINIDTEPMPCIFNPQNLEAEGGWETVNLFWSHPEPWNITGYYIYRGDELVGESVITSFTDVGLEISTEYCYTIIALNEFCLSEPSNQACAATLDEFFEPPVNLIAEENGLEIQLFWDPPVLESERSSSHANGNRIDSSSQMRNLIGYEIYRDNQLLQFTSEETFTDTEGLSYLQTYCYNLTAVYDEGSSAYSNTACIAPQLGAPSNLTVHSEGDFLQLNWSAHQDNAQTGFSIYRDGEFLALTTNNTYDDTDTINNIEYCYTVLAYYDGLGQSAPTGPVCGMWSLAPVAVWIEAVGCQSLEIAWAQTIGCGPCGDEDINNLPFTATGTNVGMGDDWPVQGSQGDDYAYGFYTPVDRVIDITLCQPNTDYDTKLEIFTASDDCLPSTTGYYNDDDACEFSGLYSSLSGVALDAGQYYIVVDGFGGVTGNFGIMVSESDELASESADVNDSMAWEAEKSGVPLNIEDWNMADIATNYNPVNKTRDLTGFQIVRDGEVLTTAGPDESNYIDTGLNNGQEYCYVVIAQYEEGDAPESNEACTTPIPDPDAPQDFTVELIAGVPFAHLTWNMSDSTGHDGFNIYRDGQILANVEADIFEYDDSDIVFWPEYCWYVTAIYGELESCPTETYCGSLPEPPIFSVLSIECDEEVQSGEEIVCTINLENQFPVAGLQFTLVDIPDLLDPTDIETTARMSENDGWAIQSNEQPNGSVIIVGFNLLGGSIAVGEGPILEITLLAAQVSVQTDVELTLADAFLGDANGSPLPSYTESCMITIIPSNIIELFIPDVYLNGVDLGSLPISMTNDQPVSGFQFTLTNSNEIFEIISAETTERTDGWMISLSPTTGVVLGFNLMGTPIEPGEGPFMSLNLRALMEGQDEICIEYAIISDPQGQELQVVTECGLVTVGDVNPQYIILNPFVNNLFSFNRELINPAAADIFDENFFIAWNDNGQFYVPGFDIDQLGSVDVLDGYGGFLNGSDPLTLSVPGPPVSLDQPIEWSPFTNNLFSYLPQEQMSASDVFSAYDDDILIISNDAGQFYVPSLGVNTMPVLYPGEGYKVFVSGPNSVDFFYPNPVGLSMSAESAMIQDHLDASRSEQYMIVETGMPYAIVITASEGAIAVGDELAAYAGGRVVGATKITDLNQPIVITAWEEYHSYNLELPGFAVGEKIDLRLLSAENRTEMRVVADLDADHYGIAPLTTGEITVFEQAAVPIEYTLGQNYPNPFNPNTTIEFSIPDADNITLNIYDITGRQIRTLIDGAVDRGYHQLVWDGMDSTNKPVSAGIYLYLLQSDGVSIIRKIVVIK